MNILVLNSGSSSLKFQLINPKTEEVLQKGHIDGIGLKTCKFIFNDNVENFQVRNHIEAIKLVLSKIPLNTIDGVGHRVVHGGEYYKDATKITSIVEKRIEQLCELAPLHNPANLIGIKACKEIMPKIPQVAVFDTAFHTSLSEKSFLYAIPYEYYTKYKIRKYGFHGTSHKYVTQIASKLLKKKTPNLVTCHLGNGSSITAIEKGKSIETSMGFTPLQGLIMGTRSGDIDPEIIEFLEQKLHLQTHEIMTILNKESGLKGICGDSDVRTVHDKALNGNQKAELALEMFARRIVYYVGAYTALLPSVDAIVFTAGIGEGAYYLRRKVCDMLKNLGVKIDYKKNNENKTISHLSEITSKDSQIRVFVIPTNEELMIAKETYELLINK